MDIDLFASNDDFILIVVVKIGVDSWRLTGTFEPNPAKVIVRVREPHRCLDFEAPTQPEFIYTGLAAAMNHDRAAQREQLFVFERSHQLVAVRAIARE